MSTIDLSKLEEFEVEGIDTRDYPDFSDAFIAAASIDGRQLTDAELDYVNDQRDFVYECILKQIY